MDNNFFNTHFNLLHLFILQFILLFIFINITYIPFKLILVILFYIFAFFNKKIKKTYFLFMFLSIVFFNLLSYEGKIIFEFSIFKITSLSLIKGIQKGLNIIGMVFLSLFCVQKDLILPSKLGNMIVIVFYYYQELLNNKSNINKNKKNIIKFIDENLFKVCPIKNILKAHNNNNIKVVKKTSIKGWFFMMSIISLNLLFIFLEKEIIWKN